MTTSVAIKLTTTQKLALIALTAACSGLTGCGSGSATSDRPAGPEPWWHVTPAVQRHSHIQRIGDDEYVPVGRYTMHLRCTGAGSPTVVLDAGFGETSSAWQLVQPQVADVTRVCSYDRPTKDIYHDLPKHRTSRDMVHELRTLLIHAHIVGPYVLAGHSLGGLNMVLYTGTYPREVDGLILVDASHPDVLRKDLPLVPRRLRKTWTGQEGPNPENFDWPASLAQASTVRSLDALPLVVLSRALPGTYPDPAYTPALIRRLERNWSSLQADYTHSSSNSVHVWARYSHHAIQYEQPELVIEAIREVVKATHHSSQQLPPCGKVLENLGGQCLNP